MLDNERMELLKDGERYHEARSGLDEEGEGVPVGRCEGADGAEAGEEEEGNDWVRGGGERAKGGVEHEGVGCAGE